MKEYEYKEMFADNGIEIIGLCDRYIDPKGTPFVTLTSGGKKESGEPFPAIFSSPSEAIKRFEDELLVWLNGRRRVYIRMLPQLRTQILFHNSIHDEVEEYKYFNIVTRITAY